MPLGQGSQFGWAALLDQPTFVEHQDAVTRAKGLQPMSDHDERSVMANTGQGCHEVGLSLFIQGAGGLIEQQ